MHLPIRLRSLCCALAVALVGAQAVARASPAAAQKPDVMALVRANQWPEAEAAAARYADPVARKLVTYYRLLAPHAAGPVEIAAFMRENPDWPYQWLLAHRRDAALAEDPDTAEVAALCQAHTPAAADALERCAEALSPDAATPAAAAVPFARRAWVAGDRGIGWETQFLQRWGSALRPADQLARFNALAWRDPTAAARQAARLQGDERLVAEARLALRRNAPDAATALAAVPPARANDPMLVFEHARWLRRAGQYDAALALWLADGSAAEQAAPENRRIAFWRQREVLARRLLLIGNAAGAYKLVDAHGLTGGEARLDAEFLAGFIALRMLHDGDAAARHFRALMDGSHSAITLARGHYWLARALRQSGAKAEAVTAEFTQAAAWPTTFYGQLAVLALGEGPAGLQRRIDALHDPKAMPDQALDFAGRELARAAALLTGWGEARRAQGFLLRLEEVAPDPADRSLSARLALGLGLPQTAVFIARRAGSHGLMLAGAGWPTPVSVPGAEGLDPALVLGLIRQESSFDIGAVSPSGARGLMQLMPPTAREAAHKLGARVAIGALTVDPGYNMQLGTYYLRTMLDRFNGCTPLAIAAYNAGPNRVAQWVGENGDPCDGQVNMVDWLELIPFSETRNYVQRVTENAVVYAAKAARTAGTGAPPAYLLARWLH